MWFLRENGEQKLICHKCNQEVSQKLHRHEKWPDLPEYKCSCGEAQFQEDIKNYCYTKEEYEKEEERRKEEERKIRKEERERRRDFYDRIRNRTEITSENYSGMEYEDIYIYEK